jgi:hypothetical protein
MSGKIRAGAREPAASVSSRLVRSAGGRAVAVEITMPLPDLEVGYRFRVLGDEIKDRGFGFTGAPTGRPPLPEEAPNRNGAARARSSRQVWSDWHRQEARRLQAEGGLSQSQIALEVCGDRKFRSTVQLWLCERAAVA